MNTQLKFVLVALIGLSFWFYSSQGSNQPVPSRGPASEDFESRESYDEETDYYDSYQFQHDPSKPRKLEKSRPNDPNQKNKKLKKKKSKDPIGDDVEFSRIEKLDNDTLCRLGQARACLISGKALLNSNSRKAIQLIAKACNLRDFTACEETGKIMKEVYGEVAAFNYFKSACDNASYADGCFETASYLEATHGESLEKITNYYRIACAEGSSQSCERLANFIAKN